MSDHNGHDPKTDDHSSFRSGTNGEQEQVKVLPPDERDGFKGITLDAGDSDRRDQENRDYYEYEHRNPRSRVYVRRVKLNPLIGLLNLLVVGLLVIALIFIFFPFLLYLAIPLLIIALFNNLLRRH